MNSDQKWIVAAALEDPEPLTSWEYDFIDSMAELEDIEELTPNQAESLKKIGEKYN